MIIKTDNKNLTLKTLSQKDLEDYFYLINKNRNHLGQFGDYQDLKNATKESLEKSLNNKDNKNLEFGIWLNNNILIGRIDLSSREKGKYVIGYWLGKEYTGHGYVTISAQAIMAYAKNSLHSTDIYAGVTNGNKASVAVLNRIGFKPIKDKEKSVLYHKSLS